MCGVFNGGSCVACGVVVRGSECREICTGSSALGAVEEYGDVKETKSEGKTAIKTNIITLALMVIKTIFLIYFF